MGLCVARPKSETALVKLYKLNVYDGLSGYIHDMKETITEIFIARGTFDFVRHSFVINNKINAFKTDKIRAEDPSTVKDLLIDRQTVYNLYNAAMSQDAIKNELTNWRWPYDSQ